MKHDKRHLDGKGGTLVSVSGGVVCSWKIGCCGDSWRKIGGEAWGSEIEAGEPQTKGARGLGNGSRGVV